MCNISLFRPQNFERIQVIQNVEKTNTFCSISSPSTCFLKSALKSLLCKSSLKYFIISFCKLQRHLLLDIHQHSARFLTVSLQSTVSYRVCSLLFSTVLHSQFVISLSLLLSDWFVRLMGQPVCQAVNCSQLLTQAKKSIHFVSSHCEN